jgi:hypothetical protein
MRVLCFVFGLVLVAGSGLPAQTGSGRVQAILGKHCTGCHGAAQMSGLDLRDRAAILKGGKRGPAMEPGVPEKSLLYTAVLRTGELKMPPGKEALPESDVIALRKWIEQGAPWEAQTHKQSESEWWSFRKPRRPAEPDIKNRDWVRNPIDAFILAKLEEKGLKPVEPASRQELVRRAYFDLHGLPPTPDEVATFVHDNSPDAWAKLVDRLLASPRYGERWGRLWLDVVRYADTGGFETDIYYPNAWRFRDYVIQSLNENKPYDRFVQEQIAGDELWPDNLELEGSYYIPKKKLEHLEARIGTGLYTFGPVMHESGLDGEYLRSEWLADAVDVTGSAFLGLTIGCARCHDHKFDPITHRDYYSMQAVFAGSEEKEIPTTHIMSVFDFRQAYPKQLAVDDLKAAVNRIAAAAKQRIVARIKAKFAPEAIAAYDVPEEKRTREQKELAIDLEAAVRGIGDKQLEREYSEEEKQERRRLIEKIGEAYLKAPARYPTATVLGHSDIVPEVHILERGDHKKKGEKVGPGFPAILADGEVIKEPAEDLFVPQRRKAFALWLTQPDHPLTARVMVNRLWQGHFVRGIVGTPNDFGRQGDAPTHPELLDWLAVEFVERGWSLKAMHRMMMLSNAYQMSSRFEPANAKIDGDNRYFWRMNRRRLEAEMLRDAVVSSAGTLNLKMGGRPVMPPLSDEEKAGLKDPSQWPVNSDPAEHTRRGVYIYVKRSFRMPMFEAFDMPDTSVSCERRNVTTVAPQALALLNNEFMNEQAEKFAERLKREHGEDRAKWVEAAWRIGLGRTPQEQEKQQALEFLAAQPLNRLCLVLFNMNEFLYVD